LIAGERERVKDEATKKALESIDAKRGQSRDLGGLARAAAAVCGRSGHMRVETDNMEGVLSFRRCVTRD